MKKITAYVFILGIKSVFSNHMYRIGNKFYLQGDEGPIGLKATGSVARLIMIWWDRKFLTLMSTLGIIIYLYLRYIDDINVAVKSLPPGTYYDSRTRQLQVDCDKVESDMSTPCDVRTMSVLKDSSSYVKLGTGCSLKS